MGVGRGGREGWLTLFCHLGALRNTNRCELKQKKKKKKKKKKEKRRKSLSPWRTKSNYDLFPAIKTSASSPPLRLVFRSVLGKEKIYKYTYIYIRQRYVDILQLVSEKNRDTEWSLHVNASRWMVVLWNILGTELTLETDQNCRHIVADTSRKYLVQVQVAPLARCESLPVLLCATWIVCS